MTNPYPPQPPKRLVRSTSNRIIGGVCGGVADYLNMDVTLVRILTVLISLFTGVPVILYIIALFVIPEGNTVPTAPPPVTGASSMLRPVLRSAVRHSAARVRALPGHRSAGGSGAAGERPTAEEAVWGTEGPPWEQRQSETTASPPARNPSRSRRPSPRRRWFPRRRTRARSKAKTSRRRPEDQPKA